MQVGQDSTDGGPELDSEIGVSAECVEEELVINEAINAGAHFDSGELVDSQRLRDSKGTMLSNELKNASFSAKGVGSKLRSGEPGDGSFLVESAEPVPVTALQLDVADVSVKAGVPELRDRVVWSHGHLARLGVCRPANDLPITRGEVLEGPKDKDTTNEPCRRPAGTSRGTAARRGAPTSQPAFIGLLGSGAPLLVRSKKLLLEQRRFSSDFGVEDLEDALSPVFQKNLKQLVVGTVCDLRRD